MTESKTPLHWSYFVVNPKVPMNIPNWIKRPLNFCRRRKIPTDATANAAINKICTEQLLSSAVGTNVTYAAVGAMKIRGQEVQGIHLEFSNGSFISISPAEGSRIIGSVYVPEPPTEKDFKCPPN